MWTLDCRWRQRVTMSSRPMPPAFLDSTATFPESAVTFTVTRGVFPDSSTTYPRAATILNQSRSLIDAATFLVNVTFSWLFFCDWTAISSDSPLTFTASASATFPSSMASSYNRDFYLLG